VFRTTDGRYIGISASIQAMAERLFRAIGREDMISANIAKPPRGERLDHLEHLQVKYLSI
jgi:formyl-CoA transferase